MNGRVYDYNVGRFMSVDPVIQSPGNSQSINPYSYIMNNPLAGTDPTGYVSSCDAAKGDDCITNGDGTTDYRPCVVGGGCLGDSGGGKNFNGAEHSGGSQSNNSASSSVVDTRSQAELAKRDAVISEHVYKGEADIASVGVRLVTKEELAELGLDGLMLTHDESGFSSALYKDEVSGSYIYAFEGTTDLTDWTSGNAAEVVGESHQHFLAEQNSRTITETLGVENVSFTGHSLGGGLASLAALVTGGSANVFNAAGLTQETINIRNGNMEHSENINSYYIKDEILNYAQSINLAPAKVGNLIALPNTLQQNTFKTRAGMVVRKPYTMSQRLEMHGIDQVNSVL